MKPRSRKTRAAEKSAKPNSTLIVSQREVPCVHADQCGGCPLIRLPYPQQLEVKRNKVKDAFVQQGFAPALIERILKPTKASVSSLHYRNKAKWIIQPKDESVKMGIYFPGTHDVIDIPHCAVHANPINEVSLRVKQLLIEHQVPCGAPERTRSSPEKGDAESSPADRRTSVSARTGVLRYMIVRYSFLEKKFVLVFVTDQNEVPGLKKVMGDLLADFRPRIASIVQNMNSGEGNVLLGEANRYLYKSKDLTERFGPFRVTVGPLAFLQVNVAQAVHLYKRAEAILGKSRSQLGLDLYSGIGLFSLFLSRHTDTIMAVEENGSAALEAITSFRRNKAANILQLCSDSTEGFSHCVSELGVPDWVVLNPPRKGCDLGLLRQIQDKSPQKIVYVSCHPQTLARDIAILMKDRNDFVLKSLEPVDMFPQTDHVECLAYIERSKSSPTSQRRDRSRKSKSQHLLASGELH